MRHSRRNLRPLSRFLSGALAIVVGLCLGKIVHHDVRIWISGAGPPGEKAKISALTNYPRMPPLDVESPDTPDVYYIILDGYARADTLQRVCGFDNSEFIDFLRTRGFYVAEESCANYPFTFMSVTSSLNMRYLDDFLPPKSEARSDGPIFWQLETAVVPRMFQSKGYRFVYFASLFKSKWSAADLIFRPRPDWMQSAFSNVLFRTTALRILETNVAEEHLYQFENLKRVAHIPGPTFTVCHIVAPHPPYVFDRNGNVLHDVPHSMFTKECMERHSLDDASRRGYAEQVMYVNRRIEEDIDYLLANSSVPPIIIVQGDHGSFFTVPREMTDSNLDQFARERLPILNAYYVPDRMRAQLYPTVSPVNSFRMLFKEVYQDKFELLPEKNFVGWYSDKFTLRDVTQVFRPVESQAAGNLAEKSQTSKAAEQR